MTTSGTSITFCRVCLVVLSRTRREGEKIRVGGLVLNRLKKLKGLRFTCPHSFTELTKAMADLNRTETLFQGGIASQKQVDDENAKVATLQAKLKAQESALRITTTSINEQGSTVDAQLNEINDQLKKYVIINPVKGTVLTKYAEQYEMALLGKPLYKVADISTIILRVYITGDQLHQVKVGQKIKVFTDDGKGGYKETEGEITWINDKSEFTPKTIQTKNERANLVYAMKVNVKNDGYLKIGMYGEASWNKQ